MPNITHDLSGSLIWTDPNDPSQTVVYSPGDIGWVLASTALVCIMIPGSGFFYAGLLRRKNALSMLHLSMVTFAVVAIQWFFWGFSLTYSDTGSRFIGDLQYFGLKDVLKRGFIGRIRTVPPIVFVIYQLMFAAFTAMLAIGAFAEHARLGPLLFFAFAWTTLVYDPIACWTWNINGWSNVLSGLDFAGGTPVHISSGSAALAISVYLGKRRGYGTPLLAYKPHNTTYVVLGTVFLVFGWIGFNGGSAYAANLRAAQAVVVSILSASVGGLTWMAWDYRIEQKWTTVGFCSGAIAGLVVITPGSGYVGSPASLLFGFLAGTVCNFATQLKFLGNYDDALDIFASHAVGGALGNILTAIFAEASIAGLDGSTSIRGGWLNQHYIQLAYNVADSAAGIGYSFVMTTIILWIMYYIPGLHLDVSADAETRGIDESEMGENAYDYVALHRELPVLAMNGRA